MAHKVAPQLHTRTHPLFTTCLVKHQPLIRCGPLQQLLCLLRGAGHLPLKQERRQRLAGHHAEGGRQHASHLQGMSSSKDRSYQPSKCHSIG